MKTKINKLNKKELKTLTETYEVLSFPNDCDLVYEKQIPNTGIALVDGEIELIKKSKTVDKVEAGSLLGIHQLLNQQPVKMGCKVKKDSKIILLGKSEILEGLKNSKSKIFSFIKNYQSEL